MLKTRSAPILLAAFFLVGVVLPLIVRSPYLQDLVILTLLNAYLALSWNMLSGLAGQFSFGHAAFYGLGAYTSTILFMRLGISPWIGLLAGGAVAAAVGGTTGYISFRYGLKGAFFALVTFAVAGMFQVIATNWDFVGGAVGLMVPLKGNAPLLFQFRDKEPYYYVIFAMVAAAIYLTHRIKQSRLGYYWQAIREEETGAAVMGINPLRYKVIAMIISSAMTAMAGTFYAQWQFYLDPVLAFGGPTSISILLGAVVGGVGTVWGPVVGAMLLTVLSEFTKEMFRKTPGVDVMLYGAILMAVIIFLPQGLMGLGKTFSRRTQGSKLTEGTKGGAGGVGSP